MHQQISSIQKLAYFQIKALRLKFYNENPLKNTVKSTSKSNEVNFQRFKYFPLTNSRLPFYKINVYVRCRALTAALPL